MLIIFYQHAKADLQTQLFKLISPEIRKKIQWDAFNNIRNWVHAKNMSIGFDRHVNEISPIILIGISAFFITQFFNLRKFSAESSQK